MLKERNYRLSKNVETNDTKDKNNQYQKLLKIREGKINQIKQYTNNYNPNTKIKFHGLNCRSLRSDKIPYRLFDDLRKYWLFNFMRNILW